MTTPLFPWLRAMILPGLIFLSCQPVLAAEAKIIAGESEGRPSVKPSSSQTANTAVNFHLAPQLNLPPSLCVFGQLVLLEELE